MTYEKALNSAKKRSMGGGEAFVLYFPEEWDRNPKESYRSVSVFDLETWFQGYQESDIKAVFENGKQIE